MESVEKEVKMQICLVSLIKKENENYVEIIFFIFRAGKDQKVWRCPDSEGGVCGIAGGSVGCDSFLGKQHTR